MSIFFQGKRMGTIRNKLLSYIHAETLMFADGFRVEGGLFQF